MPPSYVHKTYGIGCAILPDGTTRPLTPEERERYAEMLARSMRPVEEPEDDASKEPRGR